MSAPEILRWLAEADPLGGLAILMLPFVLFAIVWLVMWGGR